MLAEELSREFSGTTPAVVLGVPRGGVIVASEIASKLGLPLDVVIASKVGAPGNPEYAIGAVDSDGEITQNVYAGYTLTEVGQLGAAVRDKISRRLELYRGARRPVELAGQAVILVDDGIATGLTALSAIDYVRRHGAIRIVVAVPVIAADTARALRERVDELVTIEEPEIFYAVGQFYRHFDQTSDDEVLAVLASAHEIATHD